MYEFTFTNFGPIKKCDMPIQFEPVTVFVGSEFSGMDLVVNNIQRYASDINHNSNLHMISNNTVPMQFMGNTPQCIRLYDHGCELGGEDNIPCAVNGELHLRTQYVIDDDILAKYYGTIDRRDILALNYWGSGDIKVRPQYNFYNLEYGVDKFVLHFLYKNQAIPDYTALTNFIDKIFGISMTFSEDGPSIKIGIYSPIKLRNTDKTMQSMIIFMVRFWQYCNEASSDLTTIIHINKAFGVISTMLQRKLIQFMLEVVKYVHKDIRLLFVTGNNELINVIKWFAHEMTIITGYDMIFYNFEHDEDDNPNNVLRPYLPGQIKVMPYHYDPNDSRFTDSNGCFTIKLIKDN